MENKDNTKAAYLNIQIDVETKEQLRELARLDNRTVTSYVRNFIKQEYAKKCSKNA